MTYEMLLQEHPELFMNIENASISILTEEAERRKVEEETGRKTGIVYEDDYIFVVRDAVRFPSGKRGTYLRLFNRGIHGGTVILPVTENGKIVMIRHFRHATRKFHYELPRGMYEPGLTVEENAEKELKEEIGAVPVKIVPLGDIYPDTGLLSHKVSYYYALVGEDALQIQDEEEGITEIIGFTREEVEKMIEEGQIQDGFTLNAMYLAGIRHLI